ncbi:MAG: SRPBCC family protein [Myxococcota bacterium]
MLRNILSAVVALAIAFVVVGLLLPKDYRVERTTIINAVPNTVYSHVIDLKKNEAWNPWKRADPTMKITYADTSSGAGAWYSWTSKDSGDGKLTIMKAESGQRIENALDFGDMGTATGFWTFEPEGQQTKVTWGFYGSSEGDLIMAYFGLFMDMMAGPDFEKGLQNLKEVVEGNS